MVDVLIRDWDAHLAHEKRRSDHTRRAYIATAERFCGFALVAFMRRKRGVDETGLKQADLILKRDIENRRWRRNRGMGLWRSNMIRLGEGGGWAPWRVEGVERRRIKLDRVCGALGNRALRHPLRVIA